VNHNDLMLGEGMRDGAMRVMITQSQIRFWGAGVREQVAAVHFHYGNDGGWRAGKRFIYEIAAFLAELHGRENVAAMLFAIESDVLAGKIPGEQDAPKSEGAAASGTPQPSPVAETFHARAEETTEWLVKNAPHLLDGPNLDGEARGYYKLGYRDCARDAAKLGG